MERYEFSLPRYNVPVAHYEVSPKWATAGFGSPKVREVAGTARMTGAWEYEGRFHAPIPDQLAPAGSSATPYLHAFPTCDRIRTNP